MTALAIIHRDEILDQVRSGMILREIAQKLGITKQAIHQVIKDDPEYRAALKIQAAAMVDEAKELTWAAREGLDIARAREITKFAFRYAESMDAGTWGQRGNQVNIMAEGPVSVQVVSFSETQRTIDQTDE